ncbi:hypothetical protein Tco_0281565 [Tanacetum coccineum]
MGSPLSNEKLCPRAIYLSYHPNNYYANFKNFTAEHRVMLDILKGHPFYHALTAETRVPQVYLQELWKSMKYFKENDTSYIQGKINQIDVGDNAAAVDIHFEEGNTRKRSHGKSVMGNGTANLIISVRWSPDGHYMSVVVQRLAAP